MYQETRPAGRTRQLPALQDQDLGTVWQYQNVEPWMFGLSVEMITLCSALFGLLVVLRQCD